MIHAVSWLTIYAAIYTVYQHGHRRWGHGLKTEFAALGAGLVFAAALIAGWLR